MLKMNYPESVFKNPVHFLAFGFGSGCMPRAPGTFGTLAVIPFYLLFLQLPAPWYPVLLLAIAAVGIYLCGKTAADLGIHDHPGIVWDEFAGFLLTMLFVPFQWYWLLLGFVLFRVFDILKPFPIGYLDRRVKGGFGIMLDDIVAGLFGFLVLHGIIIMTAG